MVIQAFRLAGTSADIVVDTVALFTVASIPIAYVAGVIHAGNMRVRVADLMRITREGADRAQLRTSRVGIRPPHRAPAEHSLRPG